MPSPYAIDPFLAPYMQKAFGGGQLTENDVKSLLQGPNSPFAPGMLGGMAGGGMSSGSMGSGLRLGSAPPAPIMQGPGVIEHGSSGRGMNSALVGSMLGGNGGGRGQATMGSNGNWIPGAGGFPEGGADFGGFNAPTDPFSALAAGAGK